MKSVKKSPILFGLFSLITLLAFAKQEKVLQIFRDGEIIQEYAINDIDYIEINDFIPSPSDVTASVSNDKITIKWNPIEGASYNIYRSPDSKNYTLLASELTETTYTDIKPLRGSNYYCVKAVIGDVESGYTSSAAATVTSSELENGIYLGITGFNQTIYDHSIIQLTESSVDGFGNFIDGLAMKNGTLLYYSVDQAINTMQATELPSDISTVAIVTFTDGLDQGSMMKDVPYEDDLTYLDALNHRIKNETVSGKNITAYSIGIRGKDVSDINMFRANLAKLASASDNATEVTSMAEVNAKFKEIAEQLSKSNYIQTINLKMPGVSNGTLVRFTFDNVKSAENSELYIEGKFNLKERSLEEVKYVGLTSTSGTTIKGTVDGIFVNFTFTDVQTNNVLIESEYTDEWTLITSNYSWQINSEFDKSENSDIVTERSSAVIMLVLDCSSSLAEDFIKAQNNAKDFISTLYEAVGGDEKPGKPDETIYSTVPADLSVAIWKNGTRYYLTLEQYKNANLSNVTVEGLVVLSNMENFIISPDLLQSTPVEADVAVKYYTDVLPDWAQATVISARANDINDALNNIGWPIFNKSGNTTDQYNSYLTKTISDYTYGWYYTISLYSYYGGNLGSMLNGLVRGVKPLDIDKEIKWTDPNDLSLSVVKNGVRTFINDINDDLSKYDEIEGVAVFVKGQQFIIQLNDAQTTPLEIGTALSLYEDILPTKDIAEIISMKYYDINNALKKFGGSEFISSGNTTNQYNSYLSKTLSDSSYGNFYTISLRSHTGGKLDEMRSGLVRGVKIIL